MYRESVIEAGDSQHFREAAGSEQSNSIYLYKHTQTSVTIVRLSRESYLNSFGEEVYKLLREITFLVFAKDLHCLIVLDHNKEMARHA